jgi:hypothetical protein
LSWLLLLNLWSLVSFKFLMIIPSTTKEFHHEQTLLKYIFIGYFLLKNVIFWSYTAHFPTLPPTAYQNYMGDRFPIDKPDPCCRPHLNGPVKGNHWSRPEILSALSNLEAGWAMKETTNNWITAKAKIKHLEKTNFHWDQEIDG